VLPALHGLDANFSIANVCRALQGIKTHRTPGGDGIPTYFYQSALKEKKDLEEWIAEQAAKAKQGNQPSITGAGRAGDWEDIATL
jgi:hypothetical protein